MKWISPAIWFMGAGLLVIIALEDLINDEASRVTAFLLGVSVAYFGIGIIRALMIVVEEMKRKSDD